MSWNFFLFSTAVVFLPSALSNPLPFFLACVVHSKIHILARAHLILFSSPEIRAFEQQCFFGLDFVLLVLCDKLVSTTKKGRHIWEMDV